MCVLCTFFVGILATLAARCKGRQFCANQIVSDAAVCALGFSLGQHLGGRKPYGRTRASPKSKRTPSEVLLHCIIEPIARLGARHATRVGRRAGDGFIGVLNETRNETHSVI